MAALPILTDDEPPARSLGEILTLARADGFTATDATYLELALRKGLPPASRDRARVDAAGRCGVTTLRMTRDSVPRDRGPTT